MTSRHLVDPELLELLDNYPPFEFTIEALPTTRAQVDMLTKALERPDLPVDVDYLGIAGPAGAPDLSVAVFRPQGEQGPLPVYFHIHGGGHVTGSPALSERQNMRIAHELRCAVVSTDFRLAPETPHPGGLEDCYAALGWVVTNAGKLGFDAGRIAIGGESAGGGLAASLCLLARDRGAVRPVGQVLIYPMLDDRTAVSDDPHPHAGEFAWTQEADRFGWQCLLGQAPGGNEQPAYAVPARADDLTRLPPTFISVGALDLFAEEDIEYARRLMRAGVPTELHVYPGAFHAFDLAEAATVSQAAWSNMTAAIARMLRED